MYKNFLKKTLIISIIIIFIGLSVAPAISGIDFKSNINKAVEEINQIQDASPLTFYVFDKSGMKQQEILLPNNIAENITLMFDDLKFKFESDPLGEGTQNLLVDFVDLLDLYGLLPEGVSRHDMFSLINPPWFRFLNKVLSFTSDCPFLRSSVLNFLNSYFNVDDKLVSCFFDKPGLSSEVVLLCNVASAGLGIPFPFFMLPRPRGVALWAASSAYTAVGSLLQTKNFIASGNQQGVALGFIGFGISAYFGWFGYALIGYAGLLIINAQTITPVEPPNHAPLISDENPKSGSWGIPVTLSELSFRISDADGDRMSYTVTTSPDIGSGSGNLKKDGIYKIPISGILIDKEYTWKVEVNDGKETITKEFDFYTGEPDIIFSDDFNDNIKDFSKWTESSDNGKWEEVNQRTEFTLSGTGNPNREQIESIFVPVLITEDKSVIITIDFISKIASDIDAGQIRFTVRDDKDNYITIDYYRVENLLQYLDSINPNWIVIGTHGEGEWNNNIEIYSNRYRVKMAGFDSGWVYNSLFSSSEQIKIILNNKLEWPSGSWTSGFDNAFILSK